MPIQSRCTNPECGRAYTLPDDANGRSLRCKKCGDTFIATSSATVAGKLPAVAAKPATDEVLEPAWDSPSSAAPSSATVSVGNTVGRFVIRGKLGSGAFGTVYRAYDPQLDRVVALKVPNPGVMTDAKRAERFLREAKAAANLRHPHIVPVFDAGKDGDQYYIASAFIDGKPLSDSIEENGTDFSRAARIVRELAEALAYAHEQGIVHRDVKPQNIMVDTHDRVHLMDFGLAARQEEAAKLTSDGAVMGTPSYMSPEQARGQKGDVQPATDQYAVGVVLYELLTGRTPFSGPLAVVIHNVINTIPDSPRVHRTYIPRDLETICLKAMSKRPEDRYADCQELADDLRRWQDGEPISARRMAFHERAIRWVKKEPKLAGALAAVAVVVFASLLFITNAARNAERDAQAARDAEKRAADALAEATDAKRQAAQASDDVLGALGTAEEERKKALAERAKFEKEKLRANEVQAIPTQAYAVLLSTAQREIDTGDNAVAKQVLETIPEVSRSWEWFYLSKQLTHTSELTLEGHTGIVHAASFSPDATRVVTASFDRTAKVWNVKTGAELLTLSGHADEVTATSFSVDGTRIITGSNDTTAKVWDAKTGTEVLTLKGHMDIVCSVAFSADGNRIVTGSHDTTAKVWDAKTGKEVLTFTGHSREVTSVSFSEDGTQIVTGSWDKTAKIWNSQTGAEFLTIGSHSQIVRSASLSLGGRWIVTTGDNNNAKVWDAKTGAELLTLKGHTRSVNAASFSPDGNRIVTGSVDRTAKIWDAKTGVELLTLRGHGGGVQTVVFSKDGTQIVTASSDKTAKIWDGTPPPAKKP